MLIVLDVDRVYMLGILTSDFTYQWDYSRW